MDQRFENIKIIAWDLDTTLYKAIPELSLKFKEECIKEVAKAKNLTFKKAQKIFEDYRARLGSSTLTLMTLKVGDANLIEEIQDRIGKVSYIKKDPKLAKMFAALSSFRHFLITNGKRKNALATLAALGLAPETFERIITLEEGGKPKPEPDPFKLLLKITGIPAASHLMIGDMEKVDIVPAKKLGMKTILVWGESKIADLSLPTVYDIVKVLT
jgi:HAD superfamily hydrolase (TIGR01549 family)